MENEFNYKAVPFNYIHCLNSACTRSKECLRHLAAKHVPQDTPAIMTVNPACYPQDAAHCPYHRNINKHHHAWGISTLFDNVPYKKALMLKELIHKLFSKPTYYRILHKERSISPQEQIKIANLFKQNGVEELPLFESYTEEYDWTM